MRFYVEYSIDAGHMMSVCDLFHAADEPEARREWMNRVRGHVEYAEQGADLLFAVNETEMAGKSDAEVLAIYAPMDFRAHRNYRHALPNPEPHYSGRVVSFGRAIAAMFGRD